MRRLLAVWIGVALPLFVACVALSGCKRVDDNGDGFDMDSASARKGGAAAVVLNPIKMGKGVIKGKVVWKGSKPDLGQLDAAMLAVMGEKKEDAPVCLNKECKKDEKSQQRYRIGGNDRVGNVVVWVTPPDKNSYFEFTDEDLKTLTLKPEKIIDQPHCAFVPHVEWVFTQYRAPDPKNPRKTKPSGQVVKVKNDAPISHNTKWSDTGTIHGGNVMLPPKGEPIKLPLDPETKPLRIQCNIHAWMDAYIWDFNHPYADITKYNEDNPNDDAYGTYEIHNVPTGVKLKIVAWQEDVGFLTPDQKITSGEVIEVKEGEPLVKDFEIVGK
jgi:hypothetical protein